MTGQSLQGSEAMPTETFFNLSEEKRERFVSAALDEFANNIYSKASVSRIVEKAGIAKGSVYQYFADKRDLYLYLIELAGEAKVEFLQSRQAQVDWSDFYKGFRDMLLASAQFEFASPRLMKFAGLLKTVMSGDLKDETFARMKAMSREAMSALVKMGRDQGQVRDDVPLDVEAFYVNSIVSQMSEYIAAKLGMDLETLAVELEKWTRSPHPKDRDPGAPVYVLGVNFTELVEDLVKMVRSGLEPPCPARPS